MTRKSLLNQETYIIWTYQSALFFGIWKLDCGKLGVWLLLFPDGGEPWETCMLESGHNPGMGNTVHGGVDELEGRCSVDFPISNGQSLDCG
jgi:hypothetical protein